MQSFDSQYREEQHNVQEAIKCTPENIVKHNHGVRDGMVGSFGTFGRYFVSQEPHRKPCFAIMPFRGVDPKTRKLAPRNLKVFGVKIKPVEKTLECPARATYSCILRQDRVFRSCSTSEFLAGGRETLA